VLPTCTLQSLCLLQQEQADKDVVVNDHEYLRSAGLVNADALQIYEQNYVR
jgi:hypothetical protein